MMLTPGFVWVWTRPLCQMMLVGCMAMFQTHLQIKVQNLQKVVAAFCGWPLPKMVHGRSWNIWQEGTTGRNHHFQSLTWVPRSVSPGSNHQSWSHPMVSLDSQYPGLGFPSGASWGWKAPHRRWPSPTEAGFVVAWQSHPWTLFWPLGGCQFASDWVTVPVCSRTFVGLTRNLGAWSSWNRQPISENFQGFPGHEWSDAYDFKVCGSSVARTVAINLKLVSSIISAATGIVCCSHCHFRWPLEITMFVFKTGPLDRSCYSYVPMDFV